MSKHTSHGAAATSEHELTTDELEHVSGGSFGGIREILIGGVAQTLSAPLPPPPTWSGWLYGW